MVIDCKIYSHLAILETLSSVFCATNLWQQQLQVFSCKCNAIFFLQCTVIMEQKHILDSESSALDYKWIGVIGIVYHIWARMGAGKPDCRKKFLAWSPKERKKLIWILNNIMSPQLKMNVVFKEIYDIKMTQSKTLIT